MTKEGKEVCNTVIDITTLKKDERYRSPAQKMNVEGQQATGTLDMKIRYNTGTSESKLPASLP